MSKKQSRDDLPRLQPGMVVTLEAGEEIESTTATPMPTPARIVSMSIDVPVMPLDESGYAAKFIQLRLSDKQARRLRSIQIGLEESDARLEDDSYVNSPLDAVRWMLENFV